MGTRTVPQTPRRRGPLMRWIVSCVLSIVFAGALAARGVTTSAIAGIATDSSGAPIQGARVVAVLIPSGTTAAASTPADGRLTRPRMRAGGPQPARVAQVGCRQAI